MRGDIKRTVHMVVRFEGPAHELYSIEEAVEGYLWIQRAIIARVEELEDFTEQARR